MAYETRELSGSLFKNKKRDKDTHPNLQGDALIDGIAYYVSGWTKETKDGDKWISLAFKKKEGNPKQAASKRDDDKDLPF